MRPRFPYVLVLVLVLAACGLGLALYSRGPTKIKREDVTREVFGAESDVSWNPKSEKPVIKEINVSTLSNESAIPESTTPASTTPASTTPASSAAVQTEASGDVVRIGVCQDSLVDEEARAVAHELTHIFRSFGKSVVQVLTDNGAVADGEIVPDIIICLGYFYPEKVVEARKALLDAAPDVPAKFQNRLVNNVFYPPRTKLLTHQKGRPFLVAFSGEPWDGGTCRRYDLMFVTRDDYDFHGCALGYFPVLSTTFAKRAKLSHHHLLIDDLDVDKEITPALAKREFMAMVISSCYKVQYQGIDALLRTAFFDFVSANYKKVHGLGGCRRTPGLEPLANFVEQGPKIDAVTERYKEYKFAIAFENGRYPGYVSEKMLNAMLGRSVPVYWGAAIPEKLLNPKRFIHCNVNISDFTDTELARRWAASDRHRPDQFLPDLIELLHANFSACLKEVRRLDEDDAAYLAMLRQPILLNNQVEGSIFDRRIQARQVYEALRMQQSYLVTDTEI